MRTTGASRRLPLPGARRAPVVLFVFGVVGTGALLGTAAPARGQEEPPPEPRGEIAVERDSVEVEGEGGGWLAAVVGRSPERNRIIPGFWAMHPFEPQFPELDGTQGFGGLYGHWFGATLVNSYDDRTFIVGIERTWASLKRGPFATGVGYRVGLITGYDERLIALARHTPVLPFGGVLLWTQTGPVSMDAYYVYRAITLEVGLVL